MRYTCEEVEDMYRSSHIFTIYFFFVTSAVAAPVVIDFDPDLGAPGETEFFGAYSSSVELSQGFTVSNAEFDSGFYIEDTNGSFWFEGPDGSAALSWTGPTGGSVNLVNTEGNSFSLLEMDIYLQPVSQSWEGPTNSSAFYLHGYDENNLIVASMSVSVIGYEETWQTITFDSTWSNVSHVYMSGQSSGYPAVGGAVDNIVVNIVPIPAAVWLFGSALAGLGWMRRRQAV
jgi:hypothetical protein